MKEKEREKKENGARQREKCWYKYLKNFSHSASERVSITSQDELRRAKSSIDVMKPAGE